VNSRRKFLIQAPVAIAGVVAACKGDTSQQTQSATTSSSPIPNNPGAPAAFNTAAGTGPQVSAGTFAEAEKLMQVTMLPAERDMAAGSWRSAMAPLLERRMGPRKATINDTVAPAMIWDPMAIPGVKPAPTRDRFVRSKSDNAPLPSTD